VGADSLSIQFLALLAEGAGAGAANLRGGPG
jgi:hypothetical protein